MKKNRNIQREPRRPAENRNETKYITLSMERYNEIVRENAVLLAERKLLLSEEYSLVKALKKGDGNDTV